MKIDIRDIDKWEDQPMRESIRKAVDYVSHDGLPFSWNAVEKLLLSLRDKPKEYVDKQLRKHLWENYRYTDINEVYHYFIDPEIEWNFRHMYFDSNGIFRTNYRYTLRRDPKHKMCKSDRSVYKYVSNADKKRYTDIKNSLESDFKVEGNIIFPLKFKLKGYKKVYQGRVLVKDEIGKPLVLDSSIEPIIDFKVQKREDNTNLKCVLIQHKFFKSLHILNRSTERRMHLFRFLTWYSDPIIDFETATKHYIVVAEYRGNIFSTKIYCRDK